MTDTGKRPLTLDETTLDEAQKRVFDSIASGPRGVVEGPLRVWIHSPELADTAQALGAFCRYGTSLSPRLSELAIITTGAFWEAGFEWAVHAPIAAQAGLSEAVIEAIRTGTPPPFEHDDEAAIHAFARTLQQERRVDDATYRRTVAHIGVKGTVELVGLLGYYTLISMTINAFEVPPPEGLADPFAG